MSLIFTFSLIIIVISIGLEIGMKIRRLHCQRNTNKILQFLLGSELFRMNIRPYRHMKQFEREKKTSLIFFIDYQ